VRETSCVAQIKEYFGNDHRVCLFVCFYFVIVGKKLIEKEIYKMTGPMAQ